MSSDTILPSPSFNITQSIQLVIGFVAMMALPLSSWLYVTQYVDDTIQKEIDDAVRPLEAELIQAIDDLDSTDDYVVKLCLLVRETNPSFSCVRASNLRRYSSIPVYQSRPSRHFNRQ